MLEQLPDHYQTQFADNWEHLLQQGDSRLEGKCRKATIAGKERQFSQLGKSKMRLITTRNGKTVASDTPMAKRWVRPQGYDEVTHIDEFDHIALAELPAPESEHVVSHAMAAKRTIDEVIIAALEGTAYIGVTGTDAVDVPATQKVAVNYVKDGSTANSGLILDKLTKAQFILNSNEVPTEDRYLIHTARQLQDLLDNAVEVKSSDYANVKALNEGKINRFLGFDFCMTELLTLVVASDVRTCIAYHKAGVLLGVSQDKKVQLDIRADLNHTIQIRTTLLLGATRMEEERVVLIYCDESP